MKKILYVVSTSCIGGVETLVKSLCKELRSIYNIDIAVTHKKGKFHKDFKKCAKVWDCTNDLVEDFNRLQLNTYDIIHIFNNVTLGFSIDYPANKKVQSIHFSPEVMPDIYKKLLPVISNSYKGLISDNLNWNIFRDSFIKEKLKFSYIPNFINIGDYKPIIEYKRKGILWVGKFVTSKGYFSLKLIIKKFSKENFTVISSRKETEIQKGFMGLSNQKNVKYYESVTKSVLLNFYQRHKYLLITSQHEGTPMVLLEGMACGLIPIATGCGNIKNVIANNYNGIIYNTVNDLKGFNYNSDLSRKARKTIEENYSHNTNIKKYQKIYE